MAAKMIRRLASALAVVLVAACGQPAPAASAPSPTASSSSSGVESQQPSSAPSPSPLPTPSPSPSPSPLPSGASGIVFSGGIEGQFLYTQTPDCSSSPIQVSLTLNSSRYGQTTLGIHHVAGVGAYAIDLRYVDGPWLTYGGPSGIWFASTGNMSIDRIDGSVYSGRIDADLVRQLPASQTPGAHVTGTWSCTYRGTLAPAVAGQPGGVAFKGMFDYQFLYLLPVACDNVPGKLSIKYNSDNYGGFEFVIPLPSKPGSYTVDNRYADGPSVTYGGPAGVWLGSSGAITVTSLSGNVYTGTIDVAVTAQLNLPSPVPETRVTGTWACYLQVP